MLLHFGSNRTPQYLEASPLGGVLLVVRHGLQHFLMAVRYQAQGTQDLQHGHLGLDVVLAQALGDGVDALRVGQDVRSALRVVHQRLDAADDGGVDAALRRLEVHALQEVQQTREAVQLDEARHKPVRSRHQTLNSDPNIREVCDMWTQEVQHH